MAVVLCAVTVIMGEKTVVRAGTIYDSPYVTFSPDGMAWTTDAGNREIVCYREDGSDDVRTGRSSTLKALNAGEHYYDVLRVGNVPVGRWMVHKSRVNCCHMDYPDSDSYHGVAFSRDVCLKLHFSAWWPICADCGQILVKMNFYMSREAARSLEFLEAGTGKSYYYLCPFSDNLEQGAEIPAHRCKEVSCNRYRVEYIANTDGDACKGYMEPSFHMYNNAKEYEGREVTPQTHLNKNTYGRIGWIFTGWNTKADGTGSFYEDGAEIYNLTSGDYLSDSEEGNVKLYAVWRSVGGILEIDSGEGTYRGSKGIYEVSGKYGEAYELEQQFLTPPGGHQIAFETNGGKPISPVRGTMNFQQWSQIGDWNGQLRDGTYFFSAVEGNRDCVRALYEYVPVTLPFPIREGWSFGGWYYDSEFTEYAGKAGEPVVPLQDVTLYAQWAELTLYSEDNYEAYGGCGAVNLAWEQKDGQAKAYKIYQSEDGSTWENVGSGSDIGEMNTLQIRYSYCGSEEFFTVPRTGWYRLTAYGSQGGSYGSYSGGKGGMTQGSFWLEKDEKLTIKVGGQNGFNGGGAGIYYAVGGGCTTVTSSREILMVAGGGGGAAPNGNGGDGGSAQSLVDSGMAGESGGAGGGGGLLGGRAGELIVHNHIWGVCNHIHSGTPAEYGGCYVVPTTCGKELEHIYTGSSFWSWGGSDEIYCPNCGADATKGEDCIGHETEHYKHVCPEHGVQEENTAAYTPAYCTEIAFYAPGCGQTEDYICGYPYDGYVISSKSAFGGSSYLSPSSRMGTVNPGVQWGDGFVEITAEDTGYVCELRMDDVSAKDKAAPEKIDISGVRKTPVDATTVWVDWDMPEDCGSTYFHRAESYLPDRSVKISDSNITKNCLVSGVAGYIWRLDSEENTEETGATGVRIQESGVRVPVTNRLQYLHVWTVDVAGNVSEPIHIPIGGTWENTVPWPIHTNQLNIWNADNVHYSESQDVYYVRCDGKTPFVLDYSAYIDGIATWKYQQDYAIIESSGMAGGKVTNQICVPKSDCMESKIYFAEDLSFCAEEGSYLSTGNYVCALRDAENRNLAVTQELLLKPEANTKTVNLIPIAAIEYSDRMIFSDYHSDAQKGLRIVGDGEPPVISGLEHFVKLLDRRDREVILSVTAEDVVSGVAEFYLKIQNEDNGKKEVYYPDEQGAIRVNITRDEPIFSGDFSVTAYARDYVGNETQVSRDTTEFDLQTEIRSYNGRQESVFQRGEYAVLYIAAWGYAERIEIELPAELSTESGTSVFAYEYDPKPHYRQEEQFEFAIPLYAPENEPYVITVRAYKGEKQLEQYPALTVVGVSGSVLDDFRTRLR